MVLFNTLTSATILGQMRLSSLNPTLAAECGHQLTTPWLLYFHSPGGSMYTLYLTHGRQVYSDAGAAPYEAVW